MPEGKDNWCGCGSGTPIGFRLGKKELRLGRIKGEGEREDAEGGSILTPTARASAALGGPQEASCCARFLQLQSLAQCWPCADNGEEESQAQRGRMGQEAVPTLGVPAPRNHQRQLLQRQTRHLPLPHSTHVCCCSSSHPAGRGHCHGAEAPGDRASLSAGHLAGAPGCSRLLMGTQRRVVPPPTLAPRTGAAGTADPGQHNETSPGNLGTWSKAPGLGAYPCSL